MKIIDNTKEFIAKWFNRFKIFSHLFAIWAIIYTTTNICNFRIAFEYSDGIKFLAKKETGEVIEERTKILPSMVAFFMKFAGIKIDIIVDKENDLKIKSISFADEIYIVENQNEKYEILEKKGYILFFTNSDEGIIQAKKAGIKAIRIKRNPKSKNPLKYNPGSFGEKIMPLSEI
jgi:hypothetical protein